MYFPQGENCTVYTAPEWPFRSHSHSNWRLEEPSRDWWPCGVLSFHVRSPPSRNLPNPSLATVLSASSAEAAMASASACGWDSAFSALSAGWPDSSWANAPS